VNRNLFARASALALMGIIVGAATGAMAQEADNSLQVEEVVVTAAKRETVLQRTAEAVSVLDGEAQRERGAQRLEDLQASVPNVNFSSTSNTSQLYVRGIGNTFIVSGGDPGVAFYQDNAYVSDQTSTNTSMFDIARVEVLRGPQGALYGRNAVGGALNIISAKPEDDFSGSADIVAGDFGRRESEGYITGPTGLEGTSFRASYQLRKLDGYTRNRLAGTPGAPDRLDDLESGAFRLQLASQLPTGGELNFLLSHYKQEDNGPALSVKPYNGFVYPTEAITGLQPSSDPRSIFANVGAHDLRVNTLNLELVQPIGDYSLTIVGNYRDSAQTFLNDCDGTSANACTYFRHTSSDDYYLDGHLNSPSTSSFQWIVGASYLRFDQSQMNKVNWLSLASYFVPGAPSDAPFPIGTRSGGSLETESYAAYVDLRYDLTPSWTLTAQARYGETAKDASEILVIPAFGVNAVGVPASVTTRSTPFRIGIEGQLSDDVFVYAKYATARKDGAINIGALQTSPVKPEDVRSLELGIKSNFLDRRLQVNAAVFNSEYENLQISQLVGVLVALANAPEASIKGAEVEIVAIPFKGLELSFSGGYLDGQFEKFSNGRTIPGGVGGPLQDLSGNELPYVSPLTLNFGLKYEAPAVSGIVPRLDIQYSWHDRVYFSEFNEASNSQDAVGLLNVSGSLSPEDGPWRVYAYVQNVTDETVSTGATVYAGVLGAERAVSYSAPRSFGVGLAFKF
jgi:iron complex outermembrane receptor protein